MAANLEPQQEALTTMENLIEELSSTEISYLASLTEMLDIMRNHEDFYKKKFGPLYPDMLKSFEVNVALSKNFSADLSACIHKMREVHVPEEPKELRTKILRDKVVAAAGDLDRIFKKHLETLTYGYDLGIVCYTAFTQHENNAEIGAETIKFRTARGLENIATPFQSTAIMPVQRGPRLELLAEQLEKQAGKAGIAKDIPPLLSQTQKATELLKGKKKENPLANFLHFLEKSEDSLREVGSLKGKDLAELNAILNKGIPEHIKRIKINRGVIQSGSKDKKYEAEFDRDQENLQILVNKAQTILNQLNKYPAAQLVASLHDHGREITEVEGFKPKEHKEFTEIAALKGVIESCQNIVKEGHNALLIDRRPQSPRTIIPVTPLAPQTPSPMSPRFEELKGQFAQLSQNQNAEASPRPSTPVFLRQTRERRLSVQDVQPQGLKAGQLPQFHASPPSHAVAPMAKPMALEGKQWIEKGTMNALEEQIKAQNLKVKVSTNAEQMPFIRPSDPKDIVIRDIVEAVKITHAKYLEKVEDPKSIPDFIIKGNDPLASLEIYQELRKLGIKVNFDADLKLLLKDPSKTPVAAIQGLERDPALALQIFQDLKNLGVRVRFDESMRGAIKEAAEKSETIHNNYQEYIKASKDLPPQVVEPSPGKKFRT